MKTVFFLQHEYIIVYPNRKLPNTFLCKRKHTSSKNIADIVRPLFPVT